MKTLTVQEYAALKGIAENTVYRQIRAGKLNAVKKGKSFEIIPGERVCTWKVIYKGDRAAEHLVSGCGHAKYLITNDLKAYKYCPFCGLPLDMSDYEWRT